MSRSPSPAARRGRGVDRKASEDFHEVQLPGFEPWFYKVLVDPLQKHVPASITPNSITLTSLGTILAFYALTMVGVAAPPGSATALWAHVCVGLLMLVYAVLDCLDGSHARATKQTSRLGEVLDHVVDTYGVPLTPLCVMIIGRADAIQMPLAAALCGLAYLIQLVHYYNTTHLKGKGDFVRFVNSGTLGQITCGCFAIVLAVGHHYSTRDNLLVAGLMTIIYIATVWGVIVDVIQFWPLVGGLSGYLPTLCYCVVCTAVSAIYYSQHPSWNPLVGGVPTFYVTSPHGWMTTTALGCLLPTAAVRVLGNFVIASVVKKRFSGFDVWLSVWTAALVVVAVITSEYASFSSLPGFLTPSQWQHVLTALPYVATADLLARATWSMSRALAPLRVKNPAATPSH